MGKVMSVISRGAMRFNAENRAFRELEKQKVKPVVAPKHQSTIENLEKLQKETPDFTTKANVVNIAHEKRLKQVYVTSLDTKPIVYDQTSKSNVEKPLPLQRHSENFEMGYKEPEEKNIPVGKISFRQAMKILVEHRRDPDEWTAKKVAETYKLNEDVAGNILKHFQSYELYIPNFKSDGKTKTLIRAAPMQGKINSRTKFPELMDAMKPTKKTEDAKVKAESKS